MQEKSMQIDVLIVGAGPTGLMLANQLARQGVRPLIIDRHAGPARETRALGVQARTLEIYAGLGIDERAIELGKRGTGANLWARGRKLARVPIGEEGRYVSPYPYILILGQDDNERLLGERLLQSGISVEWNTELVGMEQHPDHVVATLRSPSGESRTVNAKWVAGCDGAHSKVRELNGITFPGAPYEHVFFVADAVATGSMVPDEVNVYLWQDGFHLLFPMRGTDHWRVVGILPKSLRNRKDVTFSDVIPSMSQEAGSTLHFSSCAWFSTYRIHHRSASRFRSGRCFVLGDAAHIHSPVGAQGMNTGLQDAYNLAWKLALVVKDAAGEQLLDSYEAERLPVAQRLLNTTDRMFRFVVSDSRMAGLFRTRVLAKVAALAISRKPVQRTAFMTVSQIGVRYRRSALSESASALPKNAPQAGNRFPWLKLRLKPEQPREDLFEVRDDTTFSLMVFGQPLPDLQLPELEGVMRTYAVPSSSDNDAELDRSGIPHTSFYLVRPDGYIGLCGGKLDVPALARYAQSRLGLAANARY
jgi:2-polyprenyl-6-methoxyphenol hydroxylase-like FAD-dependent oxidoreductase